MIQNLEAVQAPRADSVLRTIAARGIDPVIREYRTAAVADSTLRRARVDARERRAQGAEARAAFRKALAVDPLHPLALEGLRVTE